MEAQYCLFSLFPVGNIKKKTNNNNNIDYTTSGSGCQMLAQAAAVAVAMYNLRSTGVPRSATQTT